MSLNEQQICSNAVQAGKMPNDLVRRCAEIEIERPKSAKNVIAELDERNPRAP
jgi:hypothetical protein